MLADLMAVIAFSRPPLSLEREDKTRTLGRTAA
jgi:hypothetical protein